MIDLTHRMARFREEAERLNQELISPKAREIDVNSDIPLEIIAALWDSGLMSLSVPRKWEGPESGTLEQALVIEWLSRGSASVGQRIMVQSLGLCPLGQFGSEQQKERFYEEVVNARKLAAFALSEPEGFSGEAVAETRAEKKGEEYVINGRKAFVSGGQQADLITLFALTDPDQGLRSGISAFIIEKGTPGLLFSEHTERTGLRGVPAAELVLEECKVPLEQRLGEEGQGYEVAQYALTSTAPLAAAQAVGLADSAFEFVLERIKSRNPQHSMASEFQPLEIILARMSTNIEAARALTYAAAKAWDSNKPEAWLLSREAKVFATDTAMWVTERAIQCLGMYGMIKHDPLERMMRDAKTMQVQMASNQVHQINIARQLLNS